MRGNKTRRILLGKASPTVAPMAIWTSAKRPRTKTMVKAVAEGRKSEAESDKVVSEYSKEIFEYMRELEVGCSFYLLLAT